jgi:hypothetical protein
MIYSSFLTHFVALPCRSPGRKSRGAGTEAEDEGGGYDWGNAQAAQAVKQLQVQKLPWCGGGGGGGNGGGGGG